MGIDISGSMLIGNIAENITIPESYEDDIYRWADDNGMNIFNQWFDCDIEGQYVGFSVLDIPVDKINEEWLKDIKELAIKFKELTGKEAMLIGTQNVW